MDESDSSRLSEPVNHTSGEISNLILREANGDPILLEKLRRREYLLDRLVEGGGHQASEELKEEYANAAIDAELYKKERGYID